MECSSTLGGEHLRAVFRVAAAFAGTVVGAGFASGQEVLQFFGLYGVKAAWGIGLAGGLLGVFGYVILRTGADLQARSHREILDGLGSPGLAAVLDGLLVLFLLGGLAAMAAGAGAVAREQFGLPALAGSTLLVTAAGLTVLFGLDSVVRAIGAVVPWLLVAVLVVAVGTVSSYPLALDWAAPERAVFPSWPLAAVAYGSYNLVLSIAVLGPLGRVSPRSALLPGALLGAGILAGGALAIHLSLFTLGPGLLEGTELPMFVLARRLAPGLGPFYALVLLAEVYTTAVANLFGLVARVSAAPRGCPSLARDGAPERADRRWVKTTVAVAAVAWCAAQLGLSALIRNFYSLMGVAGFILLAVLARRAVLGCRR
ncbi:MAG TPA: hypothetical protein VIL08_04390 [Limnochorda sp.]